MLIALSHAVLYAISFAVVLTMFVSVIGLVGWLCIMVIRLFTKSNA
jgi:hypothetical protein